MPEQHTPYDSGYRLAPVPHELPAAAAPGQYGKVDFTNENGDVVFTAWAQQTESGYILRIDEHQDVELGIETSSTRHLREAATAQLDQTLRVLTAQSQLTLLEEDPETFGAGHYVIYNDTDTRRICITEIYDGTDWSDPDRVASAWDVSTEQRTLGTPDRWTQVSEHTYTAENVHRVIDETAAWTRSVAVEHSVAQHYSAGASAGEPRSYLS